MYYLFECNVVGISNNKAFADAGPPLHDYPVEARGKKGGERGRGVSVPSACFLHVRAEEVIPRKYERGAQSAERLSATPAGLRQTSNCFKLQKDVWLRVVFYFTDEQKLCLMVVVCAAHVLVVSDQYFLSPEIFWNTDRKAYQINCSSRDNMSL